jgi:hypothetical protein
MKYIEYFNLPIIPDNLLESVESILNKPRQESVVKSDFFQTRFIDKNLKNWLETNLLFKFSVRYQIIYPGLSIHKDMGNRKLAYNYLLSLGGNNVKTMIFDDTKKLLQAEILPLKTWHSIKTDMYHGVFGLEKDNPRVSLSVTPE